MAKKKTVIQNTVGIMPKQLSEAELDSIVSFRFTSNPELSPEENEKIHEQLTKKILTILILNTELPEKFSE